MLTSSCLALSPRRPRWSRALRDFARHVEALPGAAAMVAQLEMLAKRGRRPLSARLARDIHFRSVLNVEKRIDFAAAAR